MGTMLNYLEKYGKYTFQEMPMTDVDSLALCQLAYLKFDGMVPGQEVERELVEGLSGAPVTQEKPLGADDGLPTMRKGLPEMNVSLLVAQKGLSEADDGMSVTQKGLPGANDGLAVTLESLKGHPDYENLFADVRYEKPNRALLEGMLRSRRFHKMKLNYYVNVIEEKWETQFSAVTYILEDGTPYVAYRGTDETIVGWKEDFNMAFLSPVPGQEHSVRYLNAVARCFEGPFYVGGHSKGGNLAMYSAMNCEADIRERILKIYSMDGPGFRPEVLERCGYDRISERVVKILPHSSLVGMIFQSDTYFQVVKSKTFGLLQHDPYTWQVEGNHLAWAQGLYEHRREMDNTLNEWILSLDEKQLRTFVDTLYQVIMASKADNLIDFTAEWKKSMNGVIGALKEVDEETVEILKEVIKSLFDIARANRRKQVACRRRASSRKKASQESDGSRKQAFRKRDVAQSREVFQE